MGETRCRMKLQGLTHRLKRQQSLQDFCLREQKCHSPRQGGRWASGSAMMYEGAVLVEQGERSLGGWGLRTQGCREAEGPKVASSL